MIEQERLLEMFDEYRRRASIDNPAEQNRASELYWYFEPFLEISDCIILGITRAIAHDTEAGMQEFTAVCDEVRVRLTNATR